MTTGNATLEASAFGTDIRIADQQNALADGALDGLLDMLDRHCVLRIYSDELFSSASIARIAGHLGTPIQTASTAPTVPGHDFIIDVSMRAKVDDGRPRKRANQEDFHYDYSAGRHAAYSILYLLDVPPNRPMPFVDMRRVYADLPDDLKTRIAGLEHEPGLPLVAMHPRTGVPVLSLPRRDTTMIVGLDEDEAKTLIGDLWAIVDASPHRFEAEMRSKDLFVWDGIAAVHCNPAFPRDRDRTIWFATVPLDDAPKAWAAIAA